MGKVAEPVLAVVARAFEKVGLECIVTGNGATQLRAFCQVFGIAVET